ncbi:hypothetical protein OG782_36850 [Streptomyces sp. NBC_00876]|uniref:hypothetical protein n=1 Tax=Streptomyces sp. NBC_00876 TaxID=2975853 RepID=UPI00386460BE|nr:hypothetical protein OG782_36850 [Streptomyces sp. NBC_00876]
MGAPILTTTPPPHITPGHPGGRAPGHFGIHATTRNPRHDVATACELPIVGPAPCLNMVPATPAGYVLHQFPDTEQLLSCKPRAGHRSPATGGRPPRLSPAASWSRRSSPRAVNYAFTSFELDRPDPFGVAVMLMAEDGYRVRLTEAFAR